MEKCLACIITCLITRFVTIKLLKSCSMEDLILGLRSYISNRGAWKKAVSDNAGNFKKASRQLKEIMSNINWSEVKQATCPKFGSEWDQYCPLSPHRGGAIESMVKIVKSGLNKAIRNQCMDFQHLSTTFEEIASITALVIRTDSFCADCLPAHGATTADLQIRPGECKQPSHGMYLCSSNTEFLQYLPVYSL